MCVLRNILRHDQHHQIVAVFLFPLCGEILSIECIVSVDMRLCFVLRFAADRFQLMRIDDRMYIVAKSGNEPASHRCYDDGALSQKGVSLDYRHPV